MYIFQLFREIPNLGEKNKEQPLCRPYSVKARALLHAHLSRLPLNPDTLEKDRQFIIKKAPYLILEMVNCVNALTALSYAGRSTYIHFWYLIFVKDNLKFYIFCSSETAEHRNHRNMHEIVADDCASVVGVQIASAAIAAHNRRQSEVF